MPNSNRPGLVKTEWDDLTYQVNGLAMRVHHELRPGHREDKYQRRLAELIGQAGLIVEMEKRVDVYIADSLIGYMYLDLWVENFLVVECKALNHLLTNKELGQVITYLAATGSPLGMLYNFGQKSLQFRRVFPPKKIQEWQQYLYRCIWTPPDSAPLPPIESVSPDSIHFALYSQPPQPREAESVPVRLSESKSVVDQSVPARLSESKSVVDQSVPVRLSESKSVVDQSVPVRLSESKSVVDQSVPVPRSVSDLPQASVDSYASAGVNIDAGNRAVELMRAAVQSTYGPEVLAGIGSFGGLFDAAMLKSMSDPVLVASTDGVGTKVKLAAQVGRYESIGHDIVNHCLDDILVQGARPLFFLDYVASSKLDPEMIASVVSGMAAACREAGCALLGGETAEMPGVYQPGEFDVAGAIVGVVERSHILPRTAELEVGDVLIGLRSSGPHTNGYSLIRKIFQDIALDTYFEELNGTLADALLAPHRSYLPLLLTTNNRLPSTIKALAHLTGGGFIENIPRVLPDHLNAQIDLGSWPVLPIFDLIQQQGEVDPLEMYRVFNMGLGLIAIVAPEDAASVQAAIPEETYLIGQLVPGNKKVSLS
jgi:phosphoribosylformylglycinamidine cyclo-ligase/phosphoribosylamine--glycine ligase/phosphoribosylformylglycinamidine cyclo-ligase